MFTKTMVQGPTCLANVGAGAFSTWDAVHHTFPAIGWYWVLGVHKLLPQGPVGTEGNLDGGPHVTTSSSDCPFVFLHACL